VARLIRIREYNRKKEEKTSLVNAYHYSLCKARCERCSWHDVKSKCKAMQKNCYYPPKCAEYKKTEEKT
jgi:hypothetical protein